MAEMASDDHGCVRCGFSLTDCSNTVRTTDEGCCEACTVENDTHGVATLHSTFFFNRLTALERNTSDLYRQYVTERAQHVIFRDEVVKFLSRVESRVARMEEHELEMNARVEAHDERRTADVEARFGQLETRQRELIDYVKVREERRAADEGAYRENVEGRVAHLEKRELESIRQLEALERHRADVEDLLNRRQSGHRTTTLHPRGHHVS